VPRTDERTIVGSAAANDASAVPADRTGEQG
jgi:hypothetical protein